MSKTTDALTTLLADSAIGRATLIDLLAQTNDTTIATAKKNINAAIKSGFLMALEDGTIDLTSNVEARESDPVDDEDLLGEIEDEDETPESDADEDLLGASDDETPEVGDEWTIESGKHAGHTWRHTASGGFCKDCDARLAAFWKNVEAKLTAIEKSYADLRDAAKEANAKIIEFARLFDETGEWPGK